MGTLANPTSRILFAAALVLAGIGIWEKLSNLIGRTLTFLRGYAPARLLELAALLLLFVIALQLMEIRGRVGGTKG